MTSDGSLAEITGDLIQGRRMRCRPQNIGDLS